MKNRLAKLLESEGLSPSRLAEQLDVQPSSISHLLSGRNKPSYDFIEKLLTRFPSVNPDWLLLGMGNMYRNTSAGATEQYATSDLFSSSISSSQSLPNAGSSKQSPMSKQQAQPIHPKRNTRYIEKIVVLWSDGTFSEYSPSNL